jgi:hypothetical protein
MNSNTAGQEAQRYRTQIACKHAHGDAADPRSTPCHCVEIEAPAGSDIVRPPSPGFTSVTTVRVILAGRRKISWRDLWRMYRKGKTTSGFLVLAFLQPGSIRRLGVLVKQVKWLQSSGLRTVTSRLKTVRRFFLARAMPSMISPFHSHHAERASSYPARKTKAKT